MQRHLREETCLPVNKQCLPDRSWGTHPHPVLYHTLLLIKESSLTDRTRTEQRGISIDILPKVMVGKPPTYFADVWAHEVGQSLAYEPQ